ncbi:mCG140679, partial [Mus musculus]
VGSAAACSWRTPLDPGAVSSSGLLFQMKSNIECDRI